jgi:hypothetical protein
LLALLLVGGLLYQSRYILPLQDYYGASEQLAVLQNQLQSDAIIVISDPPQSLFADRFGPLLRFVYGHDVATIRQDGEAARTFVEEMITYAEQQGKPVQLLGIQPVWPVITEELMAEPVAFIPVRLPFLENSYTGFPTAVQTVYYGLELYNLAPQTAVSPTPTLPALPLTIDVGHLDIIHIKEGVYGKEALPGPPTMRWTAERAVFTLPMVAETAVTIDVRAMIYRPDGVPEADVVVELDGVEIGRFVPDQAWQTYTFSGQAQPVNGRSRLILHTTPFNPAALQISGDQRNLGFLLDSITITPTGRP